ncbi:hypothetical protein PF010_g33035, partial [Phytophthora fragariae]
GHLSVAPDTPPPMTTLGYTAMRKPIANKGLTFTKEQPEQLGLRVLMPAAKTSTKFETERAMVALRHKTSPIYM